MSAPEPTDPATTPPPSTRVRLDLAYDGTGFHGWATQPGLVTVQGVLEDALEKIVRRPVRTTVAGRTDAGVHAAHQVVHLDLTEPEWSALTRGRAGLEPGSTLVRRLNGVLGPRHGAVIVRDAARAPAGFDARFSALRRHYRYRISDDPGTRDPLRRTDTCWHKAGLDVALMQAEADAMLGLHDFLGFCRPRPEGTTIRQLQAFDLERDAEGVIVARLSADAFCHHMVRALLAAVMAVGERRRPPGWAVSRLDAERRDSSAQLAPPHALVLAGVDYPDDDRLGARATGTRARRRSLDAEPGRSAV